MARIQDTAIPSPKAVIHLETFNLFEHSSVSILCILNCNPDENCWLMVNSILANSHQGLQSLLPTQHQPARRDTSTTYPLNQFTAPCLGSRAQPINQCAVSLITTPCVQKPYSSTHSISIRCTPSGFCHHSIRYPGLRPGLTDSAPSGLEDLNFANDLWNLR